MGNVIPLDIYKNNVKEDKADSEWDTIANIFSKAIYSEGLTERQTKELIESIKQEVKSK